jgi:hypothetical protein
MEVIKLDENNIKVVCAASQSHKIYRLDILLNNKSKIEDELETFDSKSLVFKNQWIENYDLRVVNMKNKLINRLTLINSILERLPEE